MQTVSETHAGRRPPRYRAVEREEERLDNDAGRAFRLYLAARSEGRPASEIAVLKAAYEAAAECSRTFRESARNAGSRILLMG